MTQQFMGVIQQNLIEVGSDHGAGVHHGIAQGLGLFAQVRFDPDRGSLNAGSWVAMPGRVTREPDRD
jgi:hypothetical protein